MAWGVSYYENTAGGVPGSDFILNCPKGVRVDILAVLEAVRASPPPSFSGGGMWEAMKDTMKGYYEVRVSGASDTGKSMNYRLFCLLDNGSKEDLKERGFTEPQVVVLNGMVKPKRTGFSEPEYRKVRKLGEDYRSKLPRPVAQ